MGNRKEFKDPIPEGSTALFTAIIEDEDGEALPGGVLDTLTLTLYDEDTAAIVNNRDETNILNTGPGEVDGSGNLRLTLTPDDTALLEQNHQRERRIVLLRWTFGGGEKAGAHELVFTINNLQKVQ